MVFSEQEGCEIPNNEAFSGKSGRKTEREKERESLPNIYIYMFDVSTLLLFGTGRFIIYRITRRFRKDPVEKESLPKNVCVDVQHPFTVQNGKVAKYRITRRFRKDAVERERERERESLPKNTNVRR